MLINNINRLKGFLSYIQSKPDNDGNVWIYELWNNKPLIEDNEDIHLGRININKKYSEGKKEPEFTFRYNKSFELNNEGSIIDLPGNQDIDKLKEILSKIYFYCEHKIDNDEWLYIASYICDKNHFIDSMDIKIESGILPDDGQLVDINIKDGHILRDYIFLKGGPDKKFSKDVFQDFSFFKLGLFEMAYYIDEKIINSWAPAVKYITNDGVVKQEPISDKPWLRYRFKTKAVSDSRPVIFNPKYPWWCTGYASDDSYATIVAYLPKDENLTRYWDDAFDIEYTEESEIKFSGRFPKPSYYKGE